MNIGPSGESGYPPHFGSASTELFFRANAILRMHGTSPSDTVFSFWALDGLAAAKEEFRAARVESWGTREGAGVATWSRRLPPQSLGTEKVGGQRHRQKAVKLGWGAPPEVLRVLWLCPSLADRLGLVDSALFARSGAPRGSQGLLAQGLGWAEPEVHRLVLLPMTSVAIEVGVVGCGLGAEVGVVGCQALAWPHPAAAS